MSRLLAFWGRVVQERIPFLIQYLNVHMERRLQSAISRISNKSDAFYTVDRTTGRKAYIGIYPAVGGKVAHLQTHADGKWNDNLLALPECSADCRVIS